MVIIHSLAIPLLCGLLAREVPEHQAIGMVANVAVETGYTFDYTQRQHKGPAYGLFQMEPYPGLRPSYEAYRVANCKLDSADCQLDWMTASLNGSYAYGLTYIGSGNVKSFNRTQTVAEATRVFSESILRPGKPHMDRRLEAARELESVDLRACGRRRD